MREKEQESRWRKSKVSNSLLSPHPLELTTLINFRNSLSLSLSFNSFDLSLVAI